MQRFVLLLLMALTYWVPVSITLAECDVQKNKIHWGWVLKILYSLPTQMWGCTCNFRTDFRHRRKTEEIILFFPPFSVSSKGNIAIFCDFFRSAVQFHLHPGSACFKVPGVSQDFSMNFNLNVLTVFAVVPFTNSSLITANYVISILPFNTQAKKTPEDVDLYFVHILIL